MFVLKDIAAAMDCHPDTAWRWSKRLRVPPDVVGHGAHRWKEKSFRRLIKLYEDYFKQRGTTPKIVREKFAGKLTDRQQLQLLLK
jgi:hypothetical protein